MFNLLNKYNGPYIILTMIIRSFLWQLYDEIVLFDLNFIWNSEMLKEWYSQV